MKPNVPNSALLAVALTACLAVSASGQNDGRGRNGKQDREKAEIARLENEWLNDIVYANVDGIAKILADDFVRPAPESGRFVTKGELLSYYRSHLSAQSTSKKRIEGLSIALYGSTAVARGVVVTTDLQGREISRLLFTDIFAWRNGKWQAVSAQENAAGAGSGSGQ